MCGLRRYVGRWSFPPAARELVVWLVRLERHRRCDVIDLEEAPNWLHRDIGMLDGRPTRREMRRPPKWQDLR